MVMKNVVLRSYFVNEDYFKYLSEKGAEYLLVMFCLNLNEVAIRETSCGLYQRLYSLMSCKSIAGYRVLCSFFSASLDTEITSFSRTVILVIVIALGMDECQLLALQ